jgi:hypothetical protein
MGNFMKDHNMNLSILTAFLDPTKPDKIEYNK